MSHRISKEDRVFRKRFESGAFPPSKFNHRAHVRLAYIYLCENEPDEAHRKMRQSLQAFLAHHGLDSAKYHETMTQAWILAVRHFMVRSSLSAMSAEDFIDGNIRLLDSEIMLTHYTKDILLSAEARAAFVDPDLDPIPRHDR